MQCDIVVFLSLSPPLPADPQICNTRLALMPEALV